MRWGGRQPAGTQPPATRRPHPAAHPRPSTGGSGVPQSASFTRRLKKTSQSEGRAGGGPEQGHGGLSVAQGTRQP